ncbi:hypothetical protein PIIN_06367 [Serendipita indica DSM 11827]|uniref:DUF6535 domain-containing protein n=1 Tax=Serendipita indica (strain DSM 11827) TaxID=1109443 RepID=G4TM88_SERID|nr:hypothetical protein PIIN_06367 [Serendipita indica DSM 11827]
MSNVVYKYNNPDGTPTVDNITQLAPSGSDQKDAPTIWQLYMRGANSYDQDLTKDINNTVDVLLIFAGLFSAVLTGIIQVTYPRLQPDSGAVPSYATAVNGLLFTSLFISIFVAFLGILVKQWTYSYRYNLDGVSSIQHRGRIRHYRYAGAKKWKLSSFVTFLTILMHISLLISAIGVLRLLVATAPAIAPWPITIFMIGMIIFLATILISVLKLDSPFQSPLSRFLTSLVRGIYPSAHVKKDEENNGSGLVNDTKQVLRKETMEAHITRWRLRLDFDMIVHLLRHADKSTERAILEKCFEALPILTLLGRNQPSLILENDIIPENYIFLAESCLSTDKPVVKLVKPIRSKLLCVFLRWYLSLERGALRDTLKKRLTHDNFDLKRLPTNLTNHDDEGYRALGYSALERVEHLLDEKDEKSEGLNCKRCMDRLGIIKGKPPSREDMDSPTVSLPGIKLVTGTRKPLRILANGVKTHWRLSRPYCRPQGLLRVEIWRTFHGTTEKKVWEAALKLTRDATEELETMWFRPLMKLIKAVRSVAPPSPFAVSGQSSQQSNQPAGAGQPLTPSSMSSQQPATVLHNAQTASSSSGYLPTP